MWFQQCAQIASKANNASNNWLQAIKKIKKMSEIYCAEFPKREDAYFFSNASVYQCKVV